MKLTDREKNNCKQFWNLKHFFLFYIFYVYQHLFIKIWKELFLSLFTSIPLANVSESKGKWNIHTHKKHTLKYFQIDLYAFAKTIHHKKSSIYKSYEMINESVTEKQWGKRWEDKFEMKINSKIDFPLVFLSNLFYDFCFSFYVWKLPHFTLYAFRVSIF